MNSTSDPNNVNTEPDTIEAWRSFWRVVTDPRHTSAIAAIATLALCATTIFYTVFSALQWSATEKAANAAKISADIADAEFKISSRAWMTATLSNPGGVQDGRPVVTIIDFTNTGKSPAIKVRTCQVAKIVDRSIKSLDINCPPQRMSPGVQVVLANDVTHRLADAAGGDNIPPLTSAGNLTPSLHEDLRKGKRIAITYGFVEYDDIFKIQHWTKFCSYLMILPPTPGGMPETNNWSACEVGNDIDPNYD